MILTIIVIIVVCLVGIAGGYLINLILKKFPEKLKLQADDMEERMKNHQPHINEIEEILKSHLPEQFYIDIIKEDYSLSYVGSNALYFIIITMLTSIIEALIFSFSKSKVASFSSYILVLSFFMVLRLPLLIELFISSNRRETSTILKRMTQMQYSSIMYRTLFFRIRPFLYGVAIIPLLIASII